MFSKVVAVSAVLAVAAAGLLPAAHYSPSAAVSSQSIVRHDEAHPVSHVARFAAAPVAHVAAPVAYAAPAHYVTAPAHYAAAPAHYATGPAHYAAAPVHYSAPVAHAEEYAHPKYDFSYSVADGHSGDNKSQHESRDGDAVHGPFGIKRQRRIKKTSGKSTTSYLYTVCKEKIGYNVGSVKIGHMKPVLHIIRYAVHIFLF
ncbi:unnamed protein product [Arctia plantaginis]|uniref:Uncharacterized protein n=1 Tax=Arctia plantaginis TaxID=874455 RepID=A0A8S1ACF6_ARCPL|nr:unnamed protein product [Arctia plantaginis]